MRLYHGTTIDVLEKILKEGIRCSHGRYGYGVSLARTPGEAAEWADLTAWQKNRTCKVVVLAVEIPNNIKTVPGIDEVFVEQRIPPEWIKDVGGEDKT